MKFHAHTIMPVYNPDVRYLCKSRYRGHPYGCPNYGKRDTCPPTCKLLPDMLDLSKPVWALWADFNLAAHVSKLRMKFPYWSIRQLRNCRYWQGTVRKFLRQQADQWMKDHYHNIPHPRGYVLLECPEALGINVTATMKHIGVDLEWPPTQTVRKIFIMGVPK